MKINKNERKRRILFILLFIYFFIFITANLDVTDAQIVYENLMEAIGNGLILSNYLHLFYLITPFSAIEEIKIDRQNVISVVYKTFTYA